MRKLRYFLRTKPRRFAKKHAKWLVPSVSVVLTAAIVAVAANIPVPAGNAGQFIPGVPTAPVITSVTSQDEALSIAFSAASPNGGTITTYQYSLDNGATWANRASGTTASPLVVSGLTNGTSYPVRLRAISTIGTGLSSNRFDAVPAEVPSAPTIQSSENGPFSSMTIVRDSAVQDDGKIVVTGQFTYTNNAAEGADLVRLNRDGSLDTTFAAIDLGGGIGYSVAIHDDGDIVVGGTFTTVEVNGGSSVTRNKVARFNSDGTLDTTFSPNVSGGEIYAVDVINDGKTVIGGTFTTVSGTSMRGISMLSPDGTRFADFNSGGAGINSGTVVYDVAVSPTTGDVVVVGTFDTMNGLTNTDEITLFNKLRFQSEWVANVAFQPRPNNFAYTVEFNKTGSSFYVGGAFSTLNPGGTGTVNRNVAKFTFPDFQSNSYFPSLDTFFSVTGINAFVYSLGLVDSEESILVGGGFTSPDTRLIKYDAGNGTRDTSFAPAPNNIPYTINELFFEEVYVGGDFSSIAGVDRDHSAILESSGAVDDGVTWRYSVDGGVHANTDGSAYVKFAGPSNTGGSGVGIENYEFSVDDGSTWTAFSPSISQAEGATITGLTAGTSYTIKLRAKNVYNSTQGTNSNGYGTASNAVSGTSCNAPSTPSLDNVFNDSFYDVFEDARVFMLEGDPDLGATSGGCAVTGWQYMANTTGTSFTGWTSTTRDEYYFAMGYTTDNQNAFLSSTLYYFTVRAVTQAGYSTQSTTDSDTTSALVSCTGTGALVTTSSLSGDTYGVCAFSGSGTVLANGRGVYDYYVVGGGGSGGAMSANTNSGGGGGAGGVRSSVGTALTFGSSMAASVGAGASGTAATRGNTGTGSSLGDVTVNGGGFGGGSGTPGGVGGDGGSGGGGASSTGSGNFVGGSGTTGEGNDGGIGVRCSSVTERIGAGGGGSGSAGVNGKACGVGLSGDGGSCLAGFAAKWTPVGYTGLGGGGGGANNTGLNPGQGGSCGQEADSGGDGAVGFTTAGGGGGQFTLSGITFGGGGGGGGARNGTGGAGAKGIVVVLWLLQQ